MVDYGGDTPTMLIGRIPVAIEDLYKRLAALEYKVQSPTQA
jgi:hypothetical protein